MLRRRGGLARACRTLSASTPSLPITGTIVQQGRWKSTTGGDSGSGQAQGQQTGTGEGGGGSGGQGEDIVTPWNVEAKGPRGINYDRVLTQFHSHPVDGRVIHRFHTVATELDRLFDRTTTETHSHTLHPFLLRGLAFSHRDFDSLLDLSLERIAKHTEAVNKAASEEGGNNDGDEAHRHHQLGPHWRHPFYLYTGRGPSAQSMHLGHAVPFMLVKYLQDVFRCPLVIQLTDDEKFLFRDVPLNKMDAITTNNIKDIIAFGFDPRLTFIFRNTKYMGEMYPTVLEVQRLMTHNAVKNTFGFEETDSVGKYAFAATQAAPSFVSAFPKVLTTPSKNFRCLIPCAIDQDPFFVLTRGLCDRLKRPKPGLLHTKFLPALKGASHKMSSSAEQHGVVMLNDTKAAIEKKVKSAFSGGCGTLAELKEKGADLEADVAYQYLRFFHASSSWVDELGEQYVGGKVSSGDVKHFCVETLWEQLSAWQARRQAVTDEDVAAFCAQRSILVDIRR